MPWLFQLIADRLRSLFAAEIALDLESQFVSRQTERKADLLRKARDYEHEGLDDLAIELRLEADRLSLQKPLVELGDPAPNAPLVSTAPTVKQLPPSTAAPAVAARSTRKKGKRR